MFHRMFNVPSNVPTNVLSNVHVPSEQGLVTGWLAAAKSKAKVLESMKNAAANEAAKVKDDDVPKPAKTGPVT